MTDCEPTRFSHQRIWVLSWSFINLAFLLDKRSRATVFPSLVDSLGWRAPRREAAALLRGSQVLMSLKHLVIVRSGLARLPSFGFHPLAPRRCLGAPTPSLRVMARQVDVGGGPDGAGAAGGGRRLRRSSRASSTLLPRSTRSRSRCRGEASPTPGRSGRRGRPRCSRTGAAWLDRILDEAPILTSAQ